MIRTALLAVSLAAALSTPLFAQRDLSDIAQVTLLPGWRTAEGTHMTALRVVLAPGWKTYWRAPGDAGIPPRFDWEGSDNLQAVAIHWPVPKIDVQNGLTTLVYENEVVLPIELTTERDGRIEVRADVELGVCLDICVPLHVTLAAGLDPVRLADPRIRAALADRPLSAAEGKVADARCAVEPIKDGMQVTATMNMPVLRGTEFAVIEHDDQTIWVSEASVQRSGGALVAVADLVPPTAKPFSLKRSDLVITVFGDKQAVEIVSCTG